MLLLMLLTGCESEQDRIDKHQATVNPENGKIIEVNGEKFRIIYIRGVRFRFPKNNTFIMASESSIHIHLMWPDIPPGKAPETKPIALEGRIDKTNFVEVVVDERKDPIESDKSLTFEQRHHLNSDDYIVRDDLQLGLRLFCSKQNPNFVHYAYSLTKDALTPLEREPVVQSGGFIYFDYLPNVAVRIEMMGWMGLINPDWKGIYLGVIETLNKYREDKP